MIDIAVKFALTFLVVLIMSVIVGENNSKPVMKQWASYGVYVGLPGFVISTIAAIWFY